MRQMLCPAAPGEWDVVEDSISLDADGVQFSWILALFYNEFVWFPSISRLHFSYLLLRSLFIDFSPTQYVAIRAIAEKYQMDKIGAFATSRTGNAIDLIDKVKSIRHFHVPTSSAWASEVYQQLCSRRAPISIDEGERLTPEIWVDISARREEVLWKKCEEYERAARDAEIVRENLEASLEEYKRLANIRRKR